MKNSLVGIELTSFFAWFWWH